MKGEYTGSRGRGRGRGGRADGRKSQDMGGIKSVASTGGRGLGTNRSSSNGNRGKAEQARVIRGGKSGRGEGRGRGGGRMRKGAPFPKEKAKQDASQGDRSSSGQDRKRKFPSSSYSAGRGRSNGRGGSGGRGGGRGGGGRGGDRKGRGGGHEGDDTEGLTMPANKKRRLKLERQQHRPEFDTVLRSKKIWNRLRERKVPAEEISRLAEELRGLIKGKVLNIAMKHDASRVVQTAIQFADEEARLSILSEIEGSLVELSRLTYSHFIVLRLFKETKRSEEIRKRVAKAFRGHIVRLATHSIGARVIQTALDSLPNSYTALIKAEFYGREFALFDDGDQPHSLKGVLEARPDRRNMVMKHVYGVIGRLVAKSLMQFEFAHDLLWEYMELATPLEMQDLVPQLLESYMVLLSTRAGSMAGAMCAAHGGAKERKRLMRALKGYVASSLMHRDAYISVMRLVESVDDTILCQKTILAELLKPLEGSKAMVNGVPSPGQGTSAEGWVPRGNTKPRGGKQESGSENPRKGDGEGEGDEQGDRRDHPEGEKDGGEAEEEEEDEGSEEEDGDGDGDGEVGEKAEEEDEEDEEEEEEEDENEEGNEDEEGKEDDKQGDEREAEGGPEPEEQHADEEEGRGAEPPALLAVIMHRNGCKLLLRLLAPERTGYLHPEELELLKPTLVPAAARARATSNNAETQEGGDGGPALVPSSRKDPATQRRELLAFLREPLREVCAAHADELMRSKFAGSLVLLEAMQAIGNPGLVQAVVNAACSVSLGKQPKMHEDPAGHLFMKQLLTREGEGQGKDEEESHAGGSAATPPPSCFADALVERLGPSLLDWVESNRGAFVVSALEQVPSAKDAVGKVLRAKAGREKVMELASKEGSRNTGAKVLAQQLGFGDFGVKGASADCPTERTGEAKGDSKSSRGVVKEGKEKS